MYLYFVFRYIHLLFVNHHEYMDVSANRGTPKRMVYNGKPYWSGWFGGTTIFGNPHILFINHHEYIRVHPGRLTAGPYKSPIFFKGKWPEPNLYEDMFHVNLPGCKFVAQKTAILVKTRPAKPHVLRGPHGLHDLLGPCRWGDLDGQITNQTAGKPPTKCPPKGDYMLPIGWLYGTYLLLREPGNSIDRWWQLHYVLFSPRRLGKMNPFWRAYFLMGWNPTTN